MKNREHYIHGDVSLVPIDELPKDAERIQPELRDGGAVLERGESGNTHLFTDPGHLHFYACGQGEVLIEVLRETSLQHEEHSTFEQILPGLYKKEIEREYDPFSGYVERVKD